MEDVLRPMERRDAVVFAGIDRSERVEFIKVYAIDEGNAKQALQEFFSAKNLFPADYVLVSEGFESLEGRRAITTRSEDELAAILSRLGLRLVSNGVLYVDGDGIYQLTLLNRSLYERLSRKRQNNLRGGLEVNPVDILSLGVDVLVENLSGVDLMEWVPGGAVVLHEPAVSEVAELLASDRNYNIVVETKDASKYSFLDFQAILRLPPMEAEDFARRLSNLLGIEVPYELVKRLPDVKLNERNLRGIVRLVEGLSSLGLSQREALELAIKLNLGEL